MIRVDTDKYSVLIRGDYLYVLSQLTENRRDRDKVIEKAIECFLKDYTFDQREKEIQGEEPQLRILTAPGSRPSHHMYLEFVHLPDSLVELMKMGDRYAHAVSHHRLGTFLNASIRVYLNKNYPQYLTDLIQDGSEDKSRTSS